MNTEEKYERARHNSNVGRSRNAGDRNKRICSGRVAELLGYPDPWRFEPALLDAALNRK